MNRLRHGYLELTPKLEPYFVTGHHDDEASAMASYGLGARLRLSRILAGTPNIVAAINIVIFGVIAALAYTGGFGLFVYRSISVARHANHPRFPR
jgi:hypothetical protein